MTICHLVLWAITTCAAAPQETAPQGPGLQSCMKQLSQATTALEHAIESKDGAARRAQLDELEGAAALLRKLPKQLDPAAEVEPILDELAAAIADLRHPLPDADASDLYDLARLRGACTHCHLEFRTDNGERGLFPNHGTALFGRAALEQQDGTNHDDRSGIVVFLEAPGLKSPPLPRKPVISQKGRAFQPAVLAVTVGTTVRFPNDDVVFHNVFSLSRGNAFDLGTYGKGVEQERVLGMPGLVKVHCNIHPDMAAHVLVLQNGHAAVTSPSGFWCIPDVPPGDYTLRVWQALADQTEQSIHIGAETNVELPLRVREVRPRVQHTNKFGRNYKNY